MIDFWKKFKIWIIVFVLGGSAIGVDVAIVTDAEKVSKITNDLETYYALYQDYPHVQKGDLLLGKALSESFVVNEYETSKGEHGYEIQYETDTLIVSKGFGAQADKRTWVKDRVFPVASSTPL